MSDTTPIVTTRRDGLELIDTKLRTQYDQMIAAIRDRLSADHAFVFARPERSLGGDGASTSWFAETIDDAEPLSSLAPERQEAATRKLARLEADIRRLARDLKAEGPASAELGRLVDAALTRPPGETVYVAGDRPVVVNWGYRAASQREEVGGRGGSITADNVAPPLSRGGGGGPPLDSPPLTSAQPVGRPPWRPSLAAPLCLLFLLLLLACGYLLLRACAFETSTWPAFVQRLLPDDCDPPVAADEADVAASIARLREQIRDDESALLMKAATCPAVCPAPPLDNQTRVVPPVVDDVEETCSPVELPQNAERGELELDLKWASRDDIDLSIRCPDGKTVDFRPDYKFGCGAKHDIDVNMNDSEVLNDPIEHIIWKDLRAAPAGTYEVFVTPFKRRSAAKSSQAFEVFLNHNGSIIKRKSGVAKMFRREADGKDNPGAGSLPIFSFTLPLRDDTPAQPTEGRTPSGKPCRIGGGAPAQPDAPAPPARPKP